MSEPLSPSCSRSAASANAFADRFGIPNRHASYQALADDPQVDIVYVATPHPQHAENSLMCLRAGKAVFCEKPFTINAKEAEEVIRVARERKLFLMEAMCTRHMPIVREAKRLIEEGLVSRRPYRGVFLTEKGRALAEQSRQRHEIVERFLIDLGISPEVARRDAEGIEHHVSDDTLQAFRRFSQRSAAAKG